jgi:hypothetical protein
MTEAAQLPKRHINLNISKKIANIKLYNCLISGIRIFD